MNDVQLRESMLRLAADEPPYDLHVRSVLDAGRRVRRRHQLRTAAAATLGVAMTVTAVSVAVPLVRGPAAPAGSTAPAASPQAPADPRQDRGAPQPQAPKPVVEAADIHAAIITGIRSASPDGWRFEFEERRLDGNWEVDGNADDGAGKGRIFVSAMRSQVGAMTVHPCQDHEFAQGAKCTEIPQQDGRVLVVRHLARGRSGHATTYVQLFGTEGISVTAESGNFAMDVPADPITQAKAKTPLKITRRDPLYTVEMLTALVRAVDREVQACLDSGC